MGIDFDNPLDGEFLNDFTQAKRETIGDDLARPKAYIIGKVFPNGSTATTVTDGEYGAVWIRDPGDDPGDAIQAINLTLQAHEVSFNRPVWVKKDGKKLYIMNKAPQSADYDADYPVRPQRSSNRSQLDFALIRPTDPLSLAVYLSESLYELDHTQYRVESQTSLSFDGTLPATQKAITIEVTPADGSLTYFHSGEFSGKTIRQAFDDGNITKKTSTEGRYIVGHVLLTAGQTEIIQTDVLEGDWYSTKTETLAGGLYDVSITSPQSGELIAYDGTLWRNDPSLNLDNFVIKIPGSDTRNRITPTGDFNALEFATTDGTLTSYMQQNGDWVTVNDGLENTRFGNRAGTPNGGFANTFYGELAGGAASGDDNVAIGWNSLNAITTGSANMALGSDVLSKTTTGFDNVGMGAFALSSNVSGNYNIAVGSSALNTMLSDKNVAIGYQGGAGNVNGSLNVYIGYKAGLNATGSKKIFIGTNNPPLIYGDETIERLDFNGWYGFVEQTAAPTPITDYGAIWTQSDNNLYFQDGDGETHVLHGFPTFKSETVTTQGLGANPDVYAFGFYEFSTTDANLTQVSTTVTFGGALVSHDGHAFIVAGGAGSVTGGGVVGLRVNGTSITDEGVRTIGDTETIVPDITAVALNEYIEGKKWLGTITFELFVVSGAPTAYSLDFNYGLSAYEDLANNNFELISILAIGLAGANDSAFDVQLIFHNDQNWVYAATGFQAVQAANVLASLNTDHGTYDNLASDKAFRWKHTGITQFVEGAEMEGFLVLVSSSANNAVEYCNIHVGIEF